MPLFYWAPSYTGYFKKKSGKFHFALQSGDYVANFALGIYPFTSEQKQLKKLPDALCEDIARESMRRKDDIYGEP